ncbi:MAG: class I SAM-dependent methyltransferase [Candidatus Eisenbacteria bacterium]|uniref:Class I SAM-dependent methyltransferase n=1 Tax=Eiseniibacteriota bacterium TaxID=2212470 RepID=A0A538TMM8_UNCEI|nr:MAG: class I SAM-dependent methyltransferase [Candidatus Eisenbacteria bacterium]TMQ64880.1 MAG: class I SAM-dependent methyltransferase [Candidatus Eisenbacteria bacterium]
MSPVPEARFEREYYETVYPNYSRQNPPRKLRFYRRLVERVAPIGRVPRILDIGCAFGVFLSALNPKWRRFGTDVSQFATERAAAIVPDATFARADIHEIPFSDPFDIITSFDVIEHIPSLEEVASVVQSKLVPNGHFVFVVPVYDGVTGPLIRLLDKDETHIHKRSRDFWLGWTRENFVLLEWYGIFRYLFPGLGYAHVPTRLWRRVAPAIAVIAQRRPR